jgi:hypothetical protein
MNNTNHDFGFTAVVINNFYTNCVLNEKNPKQANDTIDQTVSGLKVRLKYLHKEKRQLLLKQLRPKLAKAVELISGPKTNKLLNIKTDVTSFVNQLNQSHYLYLFIGRDAYLLYQQFKETNKTKNCQFLPLSRKVVFNKSNGKTYNRYSELIYQCYLENKNKGFDNFYKIYEENLKKQRDLNAILNKIEVLLKTTNALSKTANNKKIVVVDVGAQATLALLLTYVIKLKKHTADFKLLYSYPWLFDLFKSKSFSNKISNIEMVENASLAKFNGKNQ